MKHTTYDAAVVKLHARYRTEPKDYAQFVSARIARLVMHAARKWYASLPRA